MLWAEGCLNSESCVDILAANLLSTALLIKGDNYFFNKTTCLVHHVHGSRQIMWYFWAGRQEALIKNLVENPYGISAREVHKNETQYANKNELMPSIELPWKSISKQTFNGVSISMINKGNWRKKVILLNMSLFWEKFSYFFPCFT